MLPHAKNPRKLAPNHAPILHKASGLVVVFEFLFDGFFATGGEPHLGMI